MRHERKWFLPATNTQLYQFSHRLERVVGRLCGAYDGHRSAEFSAKAGFEAGDFRSLKFRYEAEDNTTAYSVVESHMLPIDATWDQGVAKGLLKDYYIGFNLHENKNAFLASLIESGADAGEDEVRFVDEGIVEGYLEHETSLTLIRSHHAVHAHKSVLFNILDGEFEDVDAQVGYMSGAHVLSREEEAGDLSRLAVFGEALLDTVLYENDLSVPTAADLVHFTNSLIACGLLNKQTKAFRGAPGLV